MSIKDKITEKSQTSTNSKSIRKLFSSEVVGCSLEFKAASDSAIYEKYSQVKDLATDGKTDNNISVGDLREIIAEELEDEIESMQEEIFRVLYDIVEVYE